MIFLHSCQYKEKLFLFKFASKIIKVFLKLKFLFKIICVKIVIFLHQNCVFIKKKKNFLLYTFFQLLVLKILFNVVTIMQSVALKRFC